MADSSEHELVFEIVLMNDVTRTYRFRYVDCEVMSAVFDEEQCSYVRAKPKLFSQLLNHIYQSPEVCMEAGAGVFSVRSFHKAVDGVQNNEGANARFMQTGLSVNIQEFDQYEYLSTEQSEELIFCVREVRNSVCCVLCGFCCEARSPQVVTVCLALRGWQIASEFMSHKHCCDTIVHCSALLVCPITML